MLSVVGGRWFVACGSLVGVLAIAGFFRPSVDAGCLNPEFAVLRFAGRVPSGSDQLPAIAERPVSAATRYGYGIVPIPLEGLPQVVQLLLLSRNFNF